MQIWYNSDVNERKSHSNLTIWWDFNENNEEFKIDDNLTDHL